MYNVFLITEDKRKLIKINGLLHHGSILFNSAYIESIYDSTKQQKTRRIYIRKSKIYYTEGF